MRTAVSGLRVGVPKTYFYDDLDPDVEAAMEAVKNNIQN